MQQDRLVEQLFKAYFTEVSVLSYCSKRSAVCIVYEETVPLSLLLTAFLRRIYQDLILQTRHVQALEEQNLLLQVKWSACQMEEGRLAILSDKCGKGRSQLLFGSYTASWQQGGGILCDGNQNCFLLKGLGVRSAFSLTSVGTPQMFVIGKTQFLLSIEL